MNLLLRNKGQANEQTTRCSRHFLPCKSETIASNADEYLNDAETGAKVPKAIIAPHAGYIYSGPVAATAYARLKKAHDLITALLSSAHPSCSFQWTGREQSAIIHHTFRPHHC